MRVYLDTNVLISAFKWHGAPKEVYDQVLLYHDLVIGEVNLKEVERVLREKLRITDDDLAIYISKLKRDAHVEPMPNAPAPIPERDEADAWVLASALATGAHVLVTGDRDLLDIRDEVSELVIMTPREFLDAP